MTVEKWRGFHWDDLRIHTIYEPADRKILEETCDRLNPVDVEAISSRKIREWMFSLLEENHLWRKWVWLALPQIWISLRGFIMNRWKKEVFINPTIAEGSKWKHMNKEVCLSELDDWEIEVERRKKVQLHYIDQEWNERLEWFSWNAAMIVQHEMDHLDWVLLTHYRDNE